MLIIFELCWKVEKMFWDWYGRISSICIGRNRIPGLIKDTALNTKEQTALVTVNIWLETTALHSVKWNCKNYEYSEIIVSVVLFSVFENKWMEFIAFFPPLEHSVNGKQVLAAVFEMKMIWNISSWYLLCQ